jgi:hypothetical protein
MAKRKKSPEEIEFDLLISDLRDLMKDPKFKRVIWHILGICGLYDNTFTGNSHTFYNEGKRAVGLEVLELLHLSDTTFYARLQLERSEENE